MEPALLWDAASLFGVGNINPGQLLEFYHGMHGYLAASGVDGVKVDGQSGLTAFAWPEGTGGSSGRGGTSSMVRAHVHAMEASVSEHFEGNRCINCMCHSTENLYSFRSTALLRAADDFYPDDLASQPVHLVNVVYNSLFLSPLGVPDWDMFQSAHPAASMHAAARAVGGCQVYVSDAPGHHDFSLLRKLVLPDGSTLRCPTAGRPTRDCLFVDPNTDGASALKVWNRNAVTGVVAAFNVQGSWWNRKTRAFEEEDGAMVEVHASLRAEEVEGLAEALGQDHEGTRDRAGTVVGPEAEAAAGAEGAEGAAAGAEEAAGGEDGAAWVLFGHQAQRPVLTRRGEAHDVLLKPREWEVFTVSPLTQRDGVRWAPLGLVQMLNGGGALVASELNRRGLLNRGEVEAHVTLKAAGEFGAFCEPRPRCVRVNGESVAFTHDEHNLLRVDMPPSGDAIELSVEFPKAGQ